MKYLKRYIFPILVLLGGIIDITTNLFKEGFDYLNAPLWVSTSLRVLIVICGVVRLHYTFTSIKSSKKCDEK